ncbi:MAG: hypothetical protein QXH27_01520 [Candidatus Micrarchaeia archaeon]
MSLLSADLISPSVVVRFQPFGNFTFDLFFFLVASVFIWFIDFVIDLALSYALLRFLFNYRNINRVLFAAFLGSIAGFAIDWISFISSILLSPEPRFGAVSGWAYMLVAFGLLFLAWFALAKFLLRLDAKADEIASYYVALERAGRKPPKTKPLSIRGYSLVWESARPAVFGLLMVFFTNPFWLHLLFGI